MFIKAIHLLVFISVNCTKTYYYATNNSIFLYIYIFFQQAELEKTMATCLEQLDCEKKKVSKLEEEIKFKVRIGVICKL